MIPGSVRTGSGRGRFSRCANGSGGDGQLAVLGAQPALPDRQAALVAELNGSPRAAADRDRIAGAAARA